MKKEEFCCDEMFDLVAGKEIGLVYIDKCREFGIEYRDGGSSFQLIKFCPFCGKALPISLGDRWFDELERFGIDPWGDEIPEKYQSSEWWREAEQCDDRHTKKRGEMKLTLLLTFTAYYGWTHHRA